jgi:hypothetical protein
MSGNISPTSSMGSASNWEQLFECALRERNPAVRAQRLQSAKNAIMDRIEDSLHTAYGKESRLLLAALNTISEVQGAAQSDGLRRPAPTRASGQAA